MTKTAYTVEWTVTYQGGHPRDPGYRDVRVAHAGRNIVFSCKPDGSDPWGARARPTGVSGASNKPFRYLSRAIAAKHRPHLEAAIKAHLAGEA